MYIIFFNKNQDSKVPDDIIQELQNPNLCEVCFQSQINIDPSIKLQCKHIFCLKCVTTYLEKNIENGKVKIILIRFLISNV